MKKFDLPRRLLIIVENIPIAMGLRVWLEALTPFAAGSEVAVIFPREMEI